MMPIIPKPNQCQLKDGFYEIPEAGWESLVKKEIDPSLGNQEAYRLFIKPEGIRLCAATEQGLFYGEKTLQQLGHAHGNKLPCYCICDEPAYPYRGFMIDCARHFFSVADLKTMIEAASRFKYNVFHWHLTEDQGWRVEVESYHKLVTVGSTRPCSHFGKILEPEPHSGYYTKDEIRDIVAYCKERFIDVVPEFEIPGHASAILASYPEFSCTGEPVEIKLGAGIFKDILCAGKEEVYTFIERILDEFVELFPYERIHLGGDEAPKAHWNACPDCQRKIEEEGLANANALQTYMTNRVAAYLKTKGKIVTVWNDSIKGGNLSTEITVQQWVGEPEDSVAHANAGGKIIMSEFFYYYLDYPYGQTPLRKTYERDPMPPGLEDEARANVLGVEAEIWTEYISDLDRMAYMAWPRMAAIAEAGWTKQELKHSAGFERRMTQLTGLLTELGLKIAPEEMWNIKGLKKVIDFRKFWNKTITWEGAKSAVSTYFENKKE